MTDTAQGRPQAPHPGVPAHRRPEAMCVALRLAQFGVVAGVAWLAFYAVYRYLPYVRPGADIVVQAKVELAQTGPLFGDRPGTPLVVFGDSTVLSGFVPEHFDRQSAGRVRSYNLGLPGTSFTEEFATVLQALCERGEAPRYVVLTKPWSTDEGRLTPFRFIPDDKKALQTLFPFHRLARDVTVFLMEAPHHGGPAGFYREGQAAVEQMRHDRGFYFIAGQSRYPNGRLPDDFRLDTDTPHVVFQRVFRPVGKQFRQLRRLGERHDLTYLLAPYYFRRGRYAEPPPANRETATALGPYSRFHVVGPDYLCFENRYFSDPAHLNREGAEHYTAALWELVGSFIDGAGGNATPAGH